MSSKIFISYRRGDDAGFAHALHAELKKAFSADDVFMDVQGHIKPGDTFADVIDQHVRSADVTLVLIGRRWTELLAAAPEGETDWVVHEIDKAFELGKRVVPVLVDRAEPPDADLLPSGIKALSDRQAIELRPTKFEADCSDLVDFLKGILDPQEEAAPKEEAPAPGDAPGRWRRALFPSLGLAAAVAAGVAVWQIWFAGDYQSCVQQADGIWEEIRRCAVRYDFQL